MNLLQILQFWQLNQEILTQKVILTDASVEEEEEE